MKLRWLPVPVALLAFAFHGTAAFAQDEEKPGEEGKERVEDKTKETEGIGGYWGRLIDEVEFKGYVEAHYNNPELGTMNRKDPARADLHRVVFGLEYQYSEFLKFEVEVEYEHGGAGIELEEAIVEFEPEYEYGFVAGGLLLPVGLVNDNHGPVTFWSVERPYVDRILIPSTWMEVGVGAYRRIPDAHLEGGVYLLEGLDAAGFTGLEGIRGGRGSGRESLAEDLAVLACIEYSPLPGLADTVEGYVPPPDPGYAFGASVYFGHADHDRVALDEVAVTLLEAHARYRMWGFELRAQVVHTRIDGADSVSAFTGETIGRVLQGGYLEVGYHPLEHFAPEAVDDLVIFGRYEDFDTQKEIPGGFVRDPAADRQVLTFGVAYLPIPKVVFKADVEFWEDGRDRLTRFNLGFGLVF